MALCVSSQEPHVLSLTPFPHPFSLQEIIYPLGAEIDVRAVKVGDETLSVMEIWGAEYQENDALLIKPEHRDLMQRICDRERCLMQVGVRVGGSRDVLGRVDQGCKEGCLPACCWVLSAVL